MTPPGAMAIPTFSSLLGRMSRGSLVPDAYTVRDGLEQRMYDKDPVKVSGYHAETFDMSDESRRKAYCDLMLRLFPLVQEAQVMLARNELQILSGPSGTGWWRYVEWFEYSINESSTTTGMDGEEKPEPEDESNDGGDENNEHEGEEDDDF